MNDYALFNLEEAQEAIDQLIADLQSNPSDELSDYTVVSFTEK